MKAPRTSSGQSRLHFIDSLDKLLADGPAAESTLLIYDEALATHVKGFTKFAKNYLHRAAFASGEKLKDIREFPKHVETLVHAAEDLSPRSMTVLAMGGGSIGDFAGFFASVYKRGVRLVHVPSTWLAAIDSSHGGKTALNVGGAKNQIGTFYPSSDTYLCRDLLLNQPSNLVADAMGELVKIAIIDGTKWVSELEKETTSTLPERLWKYLKPAIESKLKVVARDPKETRGDRQLLNLGHTLGHVLESAHGWSHGYSIGQGIYFALEMSEAIGILKSRERVEKLLVANGIVKSPPKKKLSRTHAKTLLLADKKRAGEGLVTFLAIEKIGRVHRVDLHVEDLLDEARRTGWIA